MSPRKRFALSVSVFVVALRGQEVLRVRRFGGGYMDGFYSLPAGAHDGGETLAQAASWELQEETGLSADPATLQLVHLLHCRQADSGDEWLGAFFQTGTWSGVARRMPDRHDEVAWRDRQRLPEPLIPCTRQALLLSRARVPFSTCGFE